MKIKTLFLLASIFLAIIAIQLIESRDISIYDDKVSLVTNLNTKNFNSQITANRSKNLVSLVHFYKPSDGKSKDYVTEYDKFATDFDGMFKVAALNCVQFKELCEKEEISEYPTFKVYPPLPAPVMLYEGKIESNPLVNYMGKFISNKTSDLNMNNFDSWIATNPNLPKAVLFTDKKGVPLIFKALSVSFDKKIEFGIVRSSDSAITSKYKVAKFPRIMIIGVNDKKPKFYEGDNKYKLIFDFMNVYSETFFKVGEDKTKSSEVTKRFPELTSESGNEICFKVDGIVCVLLVNPEKPNEKLIDLFSELQNYLSPKINRGLKYKFGWLNSNSQKKFMESVQLPVGSGPHMMLVNPGKRKRFHVLDGQLEENKMRSTFDKLASGDVRFKNFKGNSIPDLE